jgi:hypothetical protein
MDGLINLKRKNTLAYLGHRIMNEEKDIIQLLPGGEVSEPLSSPRVRWSWCHLKTSR